MASPTIRTTARLFAAALASVSTAAMAQSQAVAPATSASAAAATFASTGAAAQPQTPQPSTSASDTDAANQASNQINNVGIRGSLDKSVRIKRDSAVVLDSVNATELGRFPDSDVADSLQHITGITINRTTGGEGQYG